MSKEINNKFYKILLIYFFATGIAEGILALWLLLNIPTDPKNALILGYSLSRLSMVASLAVIVAVFLILLLKSILNSSFNERINNSLSTLFSIYDLALPAMIVFTLLFICGPYIKLLTLTPLEVIPERLSPFIILIATRLIHSGLIAFIVIAVRYLKGIRWKYSSRKITIILSSVATLLVMASLAHELIRSVTQHRQLWAYKWYFELSYEHNVPTYFSAFILGVTGIILAAIAKKNFKERFKWHWLILSIGFLYLAIDEVVIIHERLGQLVVMVIEPEDLLFSDWAYAGLLIVITLSILFFSFYKHLPPNTKRGFFISATLFVGAALGLEIIGSAILFRIGYNQNIHTAFTTVEEFLEMIAIIIFIETISTYLKNSNAFIKSEI